MAEGETDTPKVANGNKAAIVTSIVAVLGAAGFGGWGVIGSTSNNQSIDTVVARLDALDARLDTMQADGLDAVARIRDEERASTERSQLFLARQDSKFFQYMLHRYVPAAERPVIVRQHRERGSD